jgi:ribosomal protein S18 acetylase RimI-like enzyme
MTLRHATPGDAADVAGVHVRSWQVAYRGLLPDQRLDAMRAEDRVARYDFGTTDPVRPSTLVAVDGGIIRGFVTTGPCRDADGSGIGEILALYVDPPAWGRGVGRQLIAEARATLSRQGFAEASLWVLTGNSRAQNFYRADGWLQDRDGRTETIWDVSVDELRFRRTLP